MKPDDFCFFEKRRPNKREVYLFELRTVKRRMLVTDSEDVIFRGIDNADRIKANLAFQ